jgi:hypothetical protein
MNNKQTVGGIFCDLQKAFDRVNHEILLDNLGLYGIEGIFKTLFKPHLKGRRQIILLDNLNDNNLTSKWETVKSGVPQG